jgi:hypothetical protein
MHGSVRCRTAWLIAGAVAAIACRDAKQHAEPHAVASPPPPAPSERQIDPSVLGPVRSRAGADPAPVVGSPGAEPVYAVGAPGDARDYRMTVLGKRPCKVEPHFSPRAGNMKLGVEVEIEGRTEREVPVSAFYALLSDDAGNLYRPTLAGCSPALPAERVREGESIKGFITFELPDQARGLKLSYEPFVVGAGQQRLTFSLGS